MLIYLNRGKDDPELPEITTIDVILEHTCSRSTVGPKDHGARINGSWYRRPSHNSNFGFFNTLTANQHLFDHPTESLMSTSAQEHVGNHGRQDQNTSGSVADDYVVPYDPFNNRRTPFQNLTFRTLTRISWAQLTCIFGAFHAPVFCHLDTIR